MATAFILITGITLVSAVAAMSLRNLVHCALCLTVAFAGLAALYLQLNAQFVGFAQILVYIGAVAMLVVFAILLTRTSEASKPRAGRSWAAGVVVAGAVFITIAWAVLASPVAQRTAPPEATVSVQQIGEKLMTDYVLPLEALGLLLTAAMIGAVLIALPSAGKSSGTPAAAQTGAPRGKHPQAQQASPEKRALFQPTP